MKTAIVILAAGNSSRLGRPKQLLKFGDKTLLEIVTDAATSTPFRPIIMILGAYADILTQLNSEVNYINNPDWEKGMSTSIVTGVNKAIMLSPEIENIILAVADQPFITDKIFEQLVQYNLESGKNIVAANYQQTNGTPVLFNKKYFPELMSITGSGGAKEVLKKHSGDLETIIFERGEIDIDTEKDYTNLTSHI